MKLWVTATFVQYTHKIKVGTETYDNVRTVWGWSAYSSYGDFNPKALPPYGDANIFYTEKTVYDNIYKTYISSNKNDDSDWQDMRMNITRLDTGYTIQNISHGETKPNTQFFKPEDVNKTLYLRIVKA